MPRQRDPSAMPGERMATLAELAEYEDFVRHLSDERLAEDLERIASNVRFYGATQRVATLREAARRLIDGPTLPR